MANKVSSHEIKRALGKKHESDFYLTEVKTGASWGNQKLFIMDALAIQKSWASPCFSGYEIKVSRNDFTGDDKWPNYLNYCHRFSFVCPSGMIDKNELPKEVGLIYYNKDKQTLWTAKKPVHRLIDINADMLYYIIMSRLANEKHPFFSTQREALEAWVEDKANRRDLAWKVKSKFTKELQELSEEVYFLKRENEHLKIRSDKYDEFLDILKKHGISNSRWDAVENLDKALSFSMPPGLDKHINNISVELDVIKKIINGKKE